MGRAMRGVARCAATSALMLGGLGVVASAASANVTTSKISLVTQGSTTYGNPFYYVFNKDLGSQPNMTVNGTSNGTTGDMVDIDCLYNSAGDNANDLTLAGSVPVGSTGNFSATFPLADANWGCQLAAVPSGSTIDSLDLSHFNGPQMGASEERTTQDGSGHIYDYSSDVAQLTVWNQVQSPSNGGVCASYLTGANQNSTYSGYSSWGNNDNQGACTGATTLYGNDGVSRSNVQVDGRNGYLAYWAATGNTPSTSGALYSGTELPAARADISLTRSFNLRTGNATISDTENIVECQATVDPYPATHANCNGTKASGVRLQRTVSTSASGQQVTVSDKYSSVDAKPHTLDLEYDNNTTDFQQQAQEWMVPGASSFTFEGQGSAVTLGSSSVGTFYVQGSGSDPSSGPPAAITYTTEPNWAKFIHQPVNGFYPYCDNQVNYPACDLMLDYQRTVPAGGSVTITQILTTSPSVATTTSLAELSEDAQVVPTVRITRPRNGSKTLYPNVIVVGTASDLHGLRSLKIDGIPVVTDASGNWSLPLRLNPGRNTITAVATNLAGRVAQAQDHLTYVVKKTTAAKR